MSLTVAWICSSSRTDWMIFSIWCLSILNCRECILICAHLSRFSSILPAWEADLIRISVECFTCLAVIVV